MYDEPRTLQFNNVLDFFRVRQLTRGPSPFPPIILGFQYQFSWPNGNPIIILRILWQMKAIRQK
jgi:hypothetical protein